MANPNIANVTAIYGDNSLTALTTANATSIVSNAVNSNKVYKLNSIIASNSNTNTAFAVTLSFYSQAALAGTAYPIVSAVSVPSNSSVILIDKTSGLYLKENQSLGATAATANVINIVASWEDIS